MPRGPPRSSGVLPNQRLRRAWILAGQVQYEPGSNSIFAGLARNRTAVRLENLAAEIQADAGAPGGDVAVLKLLLDAEELVEDPFAKNRLDSRASARKVALSDLSVGYICRCD